MAERYEARNWQTYRMDYQSPHRALELLQEEVAVVDEALAHLKECGILTCASYDQSRMLAHREQVARTFEIPWTAISPRMQRLLYAIGAIRQPRTLIAAGIFCGNTFVSCAAAGVGAGACYQADRLIGVEIKPDPADLARRNLAAIDPEGRADIRCEDALETVRDLNGEIDLLYLDADGGPEHGKGIYLDILEAAYDRLSPGALVLAHNSVNCAQRLAQYLAFVSDPAHMRASVNMVIDPEGLEISVR